jgi:hypothetical protein
MSGDSQRGRRAGKGVYEPPASWRGSEDPLRFVKPGDHPELDALLSKLRADCDDGDPLYVDYAKRQRALALARVPAGEITGEEAKRAPAAGRAPRGKARGRLLALAALAIVGPVAALAFAVFGWGRAAGKAVSAEMAMPAGAAAAAVIVTGAAMSADVAMSADAATSAGSDTDAGTGAGTGSDTGSDAIVAAASEPAAQTTADARAKAATAQRSATARRPKSIEGIEDPLATATTSGARPGAASSATTSPAFVPASPVQSSTTKVESPSAEF